MVIGRHERRMRLIDRDGQTPQIYSCVCSVVMEKVWYVCRQLSASLRNVTSESRQTEGWREKCAITSELASN